MNRVKNDKHIDPKQEEH